MEKIGKIIDEMHLYRDANEMLGKLILWTVSWMSILVARGSADKQALGSAYMVFALSLFLEYGKKGKKRGHFICRLVEYVFVITIVAILLVSASLLLGPQTPGNYTEILFYLSAGIMCFMFLDLTLLWLLPESSKNVNGVPQDDNVNSDEAEKRIKKFMDKQVIFQDKKETTK